MVVLARGGQSQSMNPILAGPCARVLRVDRLACLGAAAEIG